MACRVGSRRVEALVAALAHVLLPVAGAPARLQVRALVQACRWHMERQDEAASWNLHWSARQEQLAMRPCRVRTGSRTEASAAMLGALKAGPCSACRQRRHRTVARLEIHKPQSSVKELQPLTCWLSAYRPLPVSTW